MNKPRTKKSYNKIWGIVINVICGLSVALFVLGILLDLGYYKYLNRDRIQSAIESLRGLKSFGITYGGALEILTGNVGVLITFLDMYLANRISMDERGEKSILGIPIGILENFNNKINRLIRALNYLFPLMMLGIMNISFVCSGYTLIFMSYSFLLKQYYELESSYSKDRLIVQMAHKILTMDDGSEQAANYCGAHRLVNNAEDYIGYINIVAGELRSSNNWHDVECLYKEICKAICKADVQTQYVVHYWFHYLVYWKNTGETLYYMAYFSFINVMKTVDISLAGQSCIDDKWFGQYWGSLQAFVLHAPDEQLGVFFGWFFDYNKRSVRVSTTIVEETDADILEITVLKEQAALLMLLLNKRWSEKKDFGEKRQNDAKRLWDLGSGLFVNERILNKVAGLEEIVGGKKTLRSYAEEIRSDVLHGTWSSYIAMIVFMGQEL